jgi:hypothetical protein
MQKRPDAPFVRRAFFFRSALNYFFGVVPVAGSFFMSVPVPPVPGFFVVSFFLSVVPVPGVALPEPVVPEPVVAEPVLPVPVVDELPVLDGGLFMSLPVLVPIVDGAPPLPVVPVEEVPWPVVAPGAEPDGVVLGAIGPGVVDVLAAFGSVPAGFDVVVVVLGSGDLAPSPPPHAEIARARADVATRI